MQLLPYAHTCDKIAPVAFPKFVLKDSQVSGTACEQAPLKVTPVLAQVRIKALFLREVLQCSCHMVFCKVMGTAIKHRLLGFFIVTLDNCG